MAAVDRRLEIIEDAYPKDKNDVQSEEPLVDHMIRVPTQEDLDEVLSVEGDMSHDIVGTGVSKGTGINNDSLGPNG